MKRKTNLKILSAMLTILMFLTIGNMVLADTQGTVTRIYGTEEKAVNCHGFTEFYTGDFFVWFQMDTSIDCASDMQTMLNQQVLGDSSLKNAANNKIKIGGMTVKQINASAGNPYSAMIAFENNGSDKVRISVWLAWGNTIIQDLFNKEQKSTVTVELLEGFLVPDNGYSLTNKVYGNITPVKYSLDITELEYLDDPENAGWTEEKSGWMKPMFENLEADWTLVSDAQPTPKPTTPPASSEASEVTSEPEPTQEPETSDVSSAISEVQESSQDEISEELSEEMSEEVSEEPESETESKSVVSETDDEESSSILPVILAVIGVVILGGGVVYYVLSSKKKGDS